MPFTKRLGPRALLAGACCVLSVAAYGWQPPAGREPPSGGTASEEFVPAPPAEMADPAETELQFAEPQSSTPQFTDPRQADPAYADGLPSALGGAAQQLQVELLPMPLEDLVYLAEENHPALQTASAQIRAAQGRAYQAGLYPNPQFAISSPQLAGSISQYNGFVTQEFVVANKLGLQQAAVQREVAQAQLFWRRTRQDVFTGVQQQFFTTLAAQRRAELLQHLVEIADRSAHAAEQLFVAGESARTDVLLAQIEADRATVALRNALVSQELGRRQLAALIGLPELMVGRLEGRLDAELPQFQLDALQQAVLAQNSLVGIARAEVGRRQFLLQRAIAEPYPNLLLMGGYQRAAEGPLADQGLFQAGFEIPLFDRNQGAIRAARADVASARARVREVEAELSAQTAGALRDFQISTQLAEQYAQRILPGARESLDLTQRLYTQGQIDFLRLLAAQKTLLDSELTYVDALEARWLAVATITNLMQAELLPAPEDEAAPR